MKGEREERAEEDVRRGLHKLSVTSSVGAVQMCAADLNVVDIVLVSAFKSRPAS